MIPADFDDRSKVWVYQANRLFSIGEALEIEDILNDFLSRWNSHGSPVKGYANLLFGQFLVFIADETATTVGGCSTDSSVKVVKEIEQRFNTSMFDRELLAFVIKDKVQVLPLSQLKYAAENGFIKAGTLYFNNLVGTKKDLLENWLVPVGKSWLARRLPALADAGEKN
ncbi:MAG: hypothetical protein K0Q66_983 [Chitinophagaceae bacterium]|nr:hypothetical protein [Chitinophagaceae bacterium]